ncbi:hypothetical protein BH11BAC7_BH11BAC7_29410 [soil metagenome]
MKKPTHLFNSHLEIIEKWSAFVIVSQENGETPQGIRERLAANNLTEEQISILMNKDAELYFKEVVYRKNLQRCLIGIPLLVAFPFVMAVEMAVLPYRLPGVGLMCLGFGMKVLGKYRRV